MERYEEKPEKWKMTQRWLTDTSAEGVKKRRSFHWGEGKDGRWHLPGVYSQQTFSPCAKNIKHMYDVCRQRTSLIQGMLEVLEGGDVSWTVKNMRLELRKDCSRHRLQTHLCRDNHHCEGKCCWQGDVFVGKKKRVLKTTFTGGAKSEENRKVQRKGKWAESVRKDGER